MSDSSIASRLARGIWYLPETLYLNFRTLPVRDALKLPYIVMGPCSLRGLKRNNVRIEGPLKTGMIRLGARKTAKRGIPVAGRTSLIVDGNGSIIFRGTASVGAGTSICANGGQISFGDRFSCNINCFIYSTAHICFGEDVLLGWDVHLRDNDGHPIYRDGVLTNPDRGISLGDRVWAASYTDILKGVQLGAGTIVGTRSLVTKSFEEEKILIAGVPAKKIRENVVWEHRTAEE